MTEQEWKQKFAKTIRIQLNKQNMNQKDLAEKSGLSEAQISMYIKAQRMPNTKALINLGNALEINSTELINFDEPIA